MSNTGSFVIAFRECSHTVIFKESRPTVGELILCRKCNDYRHVKALTGEWRWSCINCHLSKGYGTDALTARRRFETHGERFPRHRVLLYQGNSIVEELQPETGAALFNWIATNGNAHQKSLRNIAKPVDVGHPNRENHG